MSTLLFSVLVVVRYTLFYGIPKMKIVEKFVVSSASLHIYNVQSKRASKVYELK